MWECNARAPNALCTHVRLAARLHCSHCSTSMLMSVSDVWHVSICRRWPSLTITHSLIPHLSLLPAIKSLLVHSTAAYTSLSLSASLLAHFLPLFLLSLVLSTLILEMWNTKNKWHSVGMKISYISDQLNRIQYLQCMTYDKYSYSCCVTVDDCSFNL